MFKRSLILGLVSGLLAAVASLVYQKVYASSLGADFPGIINPLGIFSASLIAGILAALAWYGLTRKWKHRGEVVFSFLLTVASFISILAPFAMKLPLDIEFPEMFPGLVVPMHFFPALAWFTLKPLFFNGNKIEL